MEPTLRSALKSGVTVVTSHRRQARQIRYRFAAANQEDGSDAWESPEVMGWDDWLVKLHQDITWSGYSAPRNQRKLLSHFQEQVLWEKIIDAGDTLLDDVAGTARQASSAWGLVQAYRLPDPAKSTHPTEDVAAFANWMRRYFSRCRELSLIDHARLADIIAPAMRAGAIPPPSSLLLVGFDGFTPQQRILLKTLETLGTKMDRYKGARVEVTPVGVRCAASADEYLAAARFVRRVLASEKPGNTAVLIPELQRDRKRIERIFDDVLMPGSSLPGSNVAGRPYNMAVGERFEQSPLVVAALRLCGLLRPSARFDDLSSVLRSPFLRGGATEAPLRSRFEVWLRRHNVAVAPVSALPKLLRRFSAQSDLAFDETVTGGLVDSLSRRADAAAGKLRASAWSTLFRGLLDDCGWPGDVALDSALYQTAERWRSLLDEMSGLDFLTGPMGLGEALAVLRRLASNIKFQPQTPDLAVQILLPEQATGLQFDHLWWCGTHAGSLPAPARPNPFLPRHWQRENDMPGGSAQIELERARRMTTRLLRSASEVIVSAPLTHDDHPVSWSPLLRDIKTVNEEDLELADVTQFYEALDLGGQLLPFIDEQGPPLGDVARQEVTRGGSRVLALQAACPFRAFAEMRLHAAPLDEPVPGLDPRERGSLLHGVLERLWRRLVSSDVLPRLADGDFLEAQLWEITDEALTELDRERVLPLPARFRAVEQARLIARAAQWLDVEKRRPPFEVIGTEVKKRVGVGGLTLNLTLDRVDRLSNGHVAVIDYKTGRAEVGEWFGERPTQPQLPLYALVQKEPVDAVAYAFVQPREPGFKGVSRAGDEIPGVTAIAKQRSARALELEWDGLLDYWRARLNDLGEKFVDGKAQVDPEKHACDYCHLASLCRINTSQVSGDD